jgi:hypothetical protein
MNKVTSIEVATTSWLVVVTWYVPRYGVLLFIDLDKPSKELHTEYPTDSAKFNVPLLVTSVLVVLG